jgi:dTDP-4-dehydrorhamnose reductase
VNYDGPVMLAALAGSNDIPLIHVSTDYVFDGIFADGEEARPYREDDAMNPLNIYGQTKMLGEEGVREQIPFHVIVRTSWVFSAYANNPLVRLLPMLREKDLVRMVTDQIGTPTYAPELARALLSIADRILGGMGHGFGIYHYAGAPVVSRYDFVAEATKTLQLLGKSHATLHPALSSEFPTPARRPLYSALDCTKMKRIYGLESHDWKIGLSEAIQTLLKVTS